MEDRRYFIIHYQEIALKGKNRYIFVHKLIENIKYITEGLGVKQVREKDGRIILDLMPDAEEDQIAAQLSKIFGIANFSLANKVSSDVEILKREIHHYIKDKEFT